jgi:hypothetical protein
MTLQMKCRNREAKHGVEMETPGEIEKFCLNCGARAPGNFCATCGQETSHKTISIQSLVKEFFNDQFGYDAKVWRTLKSLLFRPGHLTNEYIEGRRVRYLTPFRTYLFLSVAFFLIFTWRENPNAALKEALRPNDTATTSKTPPSKAPTAPEAANPAPAKPESSKSSSNPIPEKSAKEKQAADRQKTEKKSGADEPRRLHFGFSGVPTTVEEYEAWQNDPKTKEKHAPWQRYLALKSIAANKIGAAEFLMRAWDNLPKILFVLVPVFALLLKLLYIRSKRLYIEHLIFALHSHAFVFVGLILMELIQTTWFILPMCLLVLPYYFFRAMRVVYRQSFWKTLLKFCLLGGVYFFVLVFGIVLVFVVTLVQV